MSRDHSRSKLDGMREKLLRFRREYLCIRSSERRRLDYATTRGARQNVDEDVGQRPPSSPLSGGAIGHRRSWYGGRPSAMTEGGPSTPNGEGRLSRRHSVPSRCPSIPESPDEEEDLEVAAAGYRPMHTMPSGATGASTDDGGLTTENDRADYDEFVRGLQSTAVTVDTAVLLRERSAEIAVGTVCHSERRPLAVPGTTTPCSGDRTSEQQLERRSLGGKLVRTLLKTFSLAGLGKNDEVENDDRPPAARPTLPTLDQRSRRLPLLSTSDVDGLESIRPPCRLNEDSNKSKWQQLVVSRVNLLKDVVFALNDSGNNNLT